MSKMKQTKTHNQKKSQTKQQQQTHNFKTSLRPLWLFYDFLFDYCLAQL